MSAHSSPYLSGNYGPIAEEHETTELVVDGALPSDLEGVFVRTGPNPRFPAEGRHHWFDGDGMLHAVHFEGGRAHYRNRYVRTRAFEAETAAGKALWTGLHMPPDFANPLGPFKDTANTDVTFHAGQLLALWWMGGDAHVVTLPTLETQGVQRYGGERAPRMAAHPKVCPRTGEMFFIDYQPAPPFLTYGVVSADGAEVRTAPVELPGPRLQHDIALTERFVVLFDLTMRWDPERLRVGKVRVVFPRDVPTRIGLAPRDVGGGAVKWFEVAPCYMYHTINAWEEGDDVVLIGCRINDPLVGDPGLARGARAVPQIGDLRLEPYLHEWRLDLRTGRSSERQLDDALGEFPRMDDRRLGRPHRYSYCPHIAEGTELRFDGVMKHDHQAGTKQVHRYPEGSFGGEVCFAPRQGGVDEDDGYVVTFVADEASGASEAYVLDARGMNTAPIARVRIPHRVPTGFHAHWVSAEELQAQRPLG